MIFFSKRKFYQKFFMQPPKFFFRCSKHQKLNLHEGFIVLRAFHTQWHVVKDAICHFGPPPPFLGLIWIQIFSYLMTIFKIGLWIWWNLIKHVGIRSWSNLMQKVWTCTDCIQFVFHQPLRKYFLKNEIWNTRNCHFMFTLSIKLLCLLHY